MIVQMVIDRVLGLDSRLGYVVDSLMQLAGPILRQFVVMIDLCSESGNAVLEIGELLFETLFVQRMPRGTLVA